MFYQVFISRMGVSASSSWVFGVLSHFFSQFVLLFSCYSCKVEAIFRENQATKGSFTSVGMSSELTPNVHIFYGISGGTCSSFLSYLHTRRFNMLQSPPLCYPICCYFILRRGLQCSIMCASHIRRSQVVLWQHTQNKGEKQTGHFHNNRGVRERQEPSQELLGCKKKWRAEETHSGQ